MQSVNDQNFLTLRFMPGEDFVIRGFSLSLSLPLSLSKVYAFFQKCVVFNDSKKGEAFLSLALKKVYLFNLYSNHLNPRNV